MGGTGGSGSGRPAVANKPSFLTGGSGGGGALAAKRGTEDLDFFIGDEAIAAASGPGILSLCKRTSRMLKLGRLWHTLPRTSWASGELGERLNNTLVMDTLLTRPGSHGAVLVKFHFQVPEG